MAKNVLSEAIKLVPVLVRWVSARMRSGETPAEVRRDIQDRTATIERNRRKRDREFEEKFGEGL